MIKTYKKITITTEPRLKIIHDENPESPREWTNLGYFITREWTNLGYFITQERSYNSPDKNPHFESIIKDTGDIARSPAEHIGMIKKTAKEEGEKVIAIYPVNKYEHSGVVYNLGTAHGFDYSNNGFYIITDKTQKGTGTKKKDFEEVIKQELEIYNKYCNGEVYGFILYDKNGEEIDSCWGFYDLEDIREHLPKEWKKEDLTEYIIC